MRAPQQEIVTWVFYEKASPGKAEDDRGLRARAWVGGLGADSVIRTIANYIIRGRQSFTKARPSQLCPKRGGFPPSASRQPTCCRENPIFHGGVEWVQRNGARATQHVG